MKRGLGFLALVPLALAACAPVAEVPGLPESDFSPPNLLSAEPRDSQTFVLAFDEAVTVLESTYALEPEGKVSTSLATGQSVELGFSEALAVGAPYRLAGEVEDSKGNRTRFVVEFQGFNGRPAALQLSELRPAKNSSTTTPHRDYAEFLVQGPGNLGGLEVSWTSGTKVLTYRFPGAEVARGDFVVLHFLPEGLPGEVDETGPDLGASLGIDALPAARDFWAKAGGLADATGIVLLRDKPGGQVVDGLFYADQAKTGSLPEGKLREGALALGLGGSYEEAFRWKPSASRTIVRLSGGGWALGDSGGESPGAANPSPTGKAAPRRAHK